MFKETQFYKNKAEVNQVPVTQCDTMSIWRWLWDLLVSYTLLVLIWRWLGDIMWSHFESWYHGDKEVWCHTKTDFLKYFGFKCFPFHSFSYDLMQTYFQTFSPSQTFISGLKYLNVDPVRHSPGVAIIGYRLSDLISLIPTYYADRLVVRLDD